MAAPGLVLPLADTGLNNPLSQLRQSESAHAVEALARRASPFYATGARPSVRVGKQALRVAHAVILEKYDEAR